MRNLTRSLLFFCLSPLTACAFAASNVPVPTSCTPAVNQALSNVVASRTTQDVDNIMVCGVVSLKERVQRGGPEGTHHVITLDVPFPNGQTVKVQVVINDALDGVILAGLGDAVYAYGQAYTAGGLWVAGVHDVHCSTHPTANNGWVVVNGVKHPPSCPSYRHRRRS